MSKKEKKEIKKETGIIKSVSFDKNNKNCMIIHFENGDTHFMAIPGGSNRIDLLTDRKYEFPYMYNYYGMIIMTLEIERHVILEGKIICIQKLD